LIHDTHGYRPYSVDFKSNRRNTSKRGLRIGATRKAPKLARFSRLSRNSAPMGAVRVDANTKKPLFNVLNTGGNHTHKLYLALAVVVGGIFATTSSTGKVDHPNLPIAKAAVPQIITPTFFFDDATNALGQASASSDAIAMASTVNNPATPSTNKVLMDQLDSLSPEQLANNQEPETNQTIPVTSVASVAEQPAMLCVKTQLRQRALKKALLRLNQAIPCHVS